MFYSKSQTSNSIDYKLALDNVRTPIMMVDRDLVITYVNGGTAKLLQEHEEVFRSIWPSFDGSNIVGQCIDQFHKDPSHQRKILDDPSNLPFIADIKVGHLVFSLTVTAQLGSSGEYIGNTLEWDNVTELRHYEDLHADYEGQIAAIHKSQAVIEFKLDGTIVKANDNFLNALGYSSAEIEGRHHRMFVSESESQSIEYKEFWDHLRAGEYKAGEYMRIDKNGDPVWIQASYNPVYNSSGQPFKVVKYASDITAQKLFRQTLETVLGQTSEAMRSLANGDLTKNIDSSANDEFTTLRNDINHCFKNLNKTLSEIQLAANSVKVEANGIANGNQNLSQRTQQQAASVEETAAAMEEMTAAVSQNADNTIEANKFVLSMAEKAKEGGKTVMSAINSMSALADSSKKISQIIGVIDEIAFQTNLLALNAAVEAARAGEQGRGFAVVASEVRGLAGRSSDAAKEIKDLIRDSEHKVQESSTLVNKSGDALNEIVENVDKVTELVGSISTACNEQSEGIVDVNQALSQIDEITQRNSTLVEEATSASDVVNQQVQLLTDLVSSFSLLESESERTTVDYASDNVVALNR